MDLLTKVFIESDCYKVLEKTALENIDSWHIIMCDFLMRFLISIGLDVERARYCAFDVKDKFLNNHYDEIMASRC